MKRDELEAIYEEMARAAYAAIAATNLYHRLDHQAAEQLLQAQGRKGLREYRKLDAMAREAARLKDEADQQAHEARKRYQAAYRYYWTAENRKDREGR